MPVRSAHILAFALLGFLALAFGPAQAGTPETPEVSDPAGDVQAAPLDLAAVWFEATDTELLVHIERAAGSDAPPPVVACQAGACAGAGVAVRAVFAVLKPDGTPAPTIEGYTASYVLVRLGVDDPAMAALAGHVDPDGLFVSDGPVNATIEGASVTVVVPRAHPALALPEGPTPGEYRVSEPWAFSAPMACAPDGGQGAVGAPAGCPSLKNQQPGVPPVSSSEWDRAPDAGVGTDYVFAAPPSQGDTTDASSGAASTVTSTTTVTKVETQTRTTTVDREVTVTSTPFPLHVEAKGAAGLGLPALLLALTMVVLLGRSRLR
jgi:hypothetical protein